ncbi:MAG TPA: pitrilysin family protein [Candidatus Paceibacterota bacterium]|nr:pitrilysin family protein [Candidatus Paceibacterota bacterium]
MAKKSSLKPIKKVRSAYGVDEYQLSNGLRVLYKKDSGAPVVAVCITFHVGSRNESAGVTGSTHILEHLLFKDSEKFKKENGNSITDYLEWFGALMNATTWLDRTNYFEMVPKERLAEALEMEADRLRGSLFNDADLASEMTVVRNEFERSRNNPFELLDEEVQYKMFEKHPYRIPTIGLKEDIEGSTAAKLRTFYDTFYWPNNATLSVFGDVSWKDVEKEVVKYFGPIPKAPHTIPQLKVKEPAQTKPRSVHVKKAMGVSIAELAYKVPEGRHKDFPAVYLLTAILAGGFASRLQHSLVDSGLASDVSTMCFPLYDPGFASFTAQCVPNVAPKITLNAMRKEISQVVAKGINKDELMRAKERVLSDAANERDGVFTEIRVTSEATAGGDWTLAYKFPKDVAKVTVADIQRVAKKYFNPNQETSGILEP